MLKFITIFIGLVTTVFAQPDHGLRNILNVGSIDMRVPETGASKFEVSCLFYEFGQKCPINLTMDVSPRALVELLWRTDNGKTRVVLSSEANTRSVNLPVVFDGDVGMTTNMHQPTKMADGWIAASFFSYARVGGTSGSIPMLTLDKQITERTRRTFVLVYRPKRT